jgi:hypothetical protein
MLDALCSMLYAALPPHIPCGMAYVHVPCAMCHVPCMCLVATAIVAAEELGAAGFVVVVVVVVVALWCVVRGAVCVLATSK